MLYAWVLESNSSFLDKTPKHEELKEEVQDFTSPKLEIFLLQKSLPRSYKKKKKLTEQKISQRRHGQALMSRKSSQRWQTMPY